MWVCVKKLTWYWAAEKVSINCGGPLCKSLAALVPAMTGKFNRAAVGPVKRIPT